MSSSPKSANRGGLSTDPQKRERQLANLKRGGTVAPAGNQRRLTHGAFSEVLVRNVETEVAELAAALAGAAPVQINGQPPAADIVALEQAARALKRWRHISAWCDAHGRIAEKTGNVKQAAELELKAEAALTAALDRLGMNPAARAKLGVDLARMRDSLEDALATGRGAWDTIAGAADDAAAPVEGSP